MDIEDFPKTCRICLKKKEIYFLIPLSLNLENESESIVGLIKSCSNIKITPSDESGLPQKICHQCLEQLKIAREVKVKCIESQTKLIKFTKFKSEDDNLTSTEFIDVVKTENIEEPPIVVTVTEPKQDSDYDDNDFKYNSPDSSPEVEIFKPITRPVVRKLKLKKVKVIIPRLTFYDDQNKNFICDVCGETHRSRTLLLRHLQTSHKKKHKFYQCQICQLTFRFRNGLLVHLKYHDNIKQFKCLRCPRAYVCNYELNKHIKTHNVDDLDVCRGCSKAFSLDYLKRHKCRSKLSESESKALVSDLKVRRTCDLCGLLVNGKPILEKHMKRTHLVAEEDSNEFECERCDKMFRSRYDLKAHNRQLHIKKKTYTCEYCQRKFVRRLMLETHQESQACVKNHANCQHCERVFKTKSGFEGHQQICTSENPMKNQKVKKPPEPAKKDWICEFCGKYLTSQSGLRRHYISNHADQMKTKKPVQHICRFCSKVFFFKYDMRCHIDVVHLKVRDFKCDLCPKSFGLVHLLRRHVKHKHSSNNYDSKKIHQCQFCPNRYEKETALINHLMHHDLTHPDRPHHCLLCTKAFKLRKALNCHMRKKHPEN